jgi:integral membrane protein (TIGR01906 family)
MPQQKDQTARTHAILYWLIFLTLPFLILSTIITAIISEPFLRAQYDRSSFPPDPLGLSQEERFQLEAVSIHYLQSLDSAEGTIHLLAEQTLPDGTLLYSQAELNHMVDVKYLTDFIRGLSGATWLILGLAIGWLIHKKQPLTVLRAISKGSLLAASLFVVLMISSAFLWSTFFVKFHELFFADGTWTFSPTSGLIRLYPEYLWFTVGVTITGGALVAAMTLMLAAELSLAWHLYKLRRQSESASDSPHPAL